MKPPITERDNVSTEKNTRQGIFQDEYISTEPSSKKEMKAALKKHSRVYSLHLGSLPYHLALSDIKELITDALKQHELHPAMLIALDLRSPTSDSQPHHRGSCFVDLATKTGMPFFAC